jgi:hypothetical protein
VNKDAPDFFQLFLNPFAPSGFRVQVGFYKLWIEENPSANFAKGQRACFLLVTNPAKAGAAGFVEKDFEEFVRVNVACC